MYSKFFRLSILIIFSLPFWLQANAQQIVPLTNKWEFRKAGDSSWLNATVPGTIHTDLLNNKKINDPYYRTNEKDLQWIGREEWQYRTIFKIDDNLLKSDKVNLVFEGLDTYANVYINGKRVLAADNMFKTYRINVKSALKSGNNVLNITFKSPIKTGEALYNSLPFRIPASDNDQESPKVSVFTRKAVPTEKVTAI